MDERLRAYAMARALAFAVMLPSGGGTVAASARPDSDAANLANSHASGAWPEPYDAAGDGDASTDSINAGLHRLGDHHQGPGGFGRVDTAQRLDRARRAVPDPGREPVRDPRRAADALTAEAQSMGLYDAPPAVELIETIKRQRDEALDLLGELLATIHGDGGHYQAKHGLKRATKDAIDTVIRIKRGY